MGVNRYFITEFIGPDSIKYAGPIVRATTQEAAQEFADYFLLSHNGNLITVIGEINKPKPKLSSFGIEGIDHIMEE